MNNVIAILISLVATRFTGAEFATTLTFILLALNLFEQYTSFKQKTKVMLEKILTKDKDNTSDKTNGKLDK